MAITEAAAPHGLPLPAEQAFRERLGSQILSLAAAIHRTEGHGRLYALAAGLVAVILATAGMQVVLNAWNGPFYNAIEHRQLDDFLHQLLVFFEIAAVLLVLNVMQTGLNQFIRLKLRELATLDLIRNWLTDRRESRITRAGEIGVNPDQRIHEDARHLTELTTDLGIGLLQSSLLLVSFIGVLWILSRGLVLHFGETSFTVPGYMVWAALIYAATGSLLSWRVGRPLVQLSVTRYAREADLRISLVRGNEHADGIALAGSEADERRVIEGALGEVLSTTRRIVFATIRLTFVTAGYGWGALVAPIVIAAPAYFGGSISFGELMMVVGAFNQVQNALRWFVDNTGAIADWRATLLRVMNFRHALLNLDKFEQGVERVERVEEPGGNLAFDDLVVMNFNAEVHLDDPHITVRPGERVLIVGAPGTGKSTLFLTIAGLWRWGTGRLTTPPAKSMLFLAQRPFLPPRSLRSLLTAPGATAAPSDAELGALLERVGVPHLAGSLDEVAEWDRRLNDHEQRRVMLAQMVVARPAWVVSDEAIDLADDTECALVTSIFAGELAGSSLVSIANRPTGGTFYSRIVRLVADVGKPVAGRLPVPAAPAGASP